MSPEVIKLHGWIQQLEAHGAWGMAAQVRKMLAEHILDKQAEEV